MMSKRAEKKWALFRLQGGRCYYCKCKMVFWDHHKRHETLPPNYATFEHLDDRYSPDRGQRFGEYRIVLACSECNNRRAEERTAELSKSELWARSGRKPRALVQ